ncbi:MAG: glycosyltransferase family 2 protein [Candidatus Omnitrophica bacterium]|nr:glycosyltransferase family 2 protein [Candidatus Omnitrophota bacterium]
MVKLIIQIPCWDEQDNLKDTLNDLPREIQGINSIETLIIDDGSSDNTIKVAKKAGVNHIISLNRHKGLARAFLSGLDTALKLGADIIVNTDADNQYKGEDIERLVRPILENRADIVVGNRQVETVEDFSWIKKRLQKIGSWAIKVLSGINVLDATSGFRSFSREAALGINVISKYTYTLETLIQAGQQQRRIEFIEIKTNRSKRKSRLVRSIPSYIGKSIVTMVRIFSFYQPLKIFCYAGSILLSLGILIGGRYFWLQFFDHSGNEHLASLFLCITLLITGFFLFLMGIIGDQISANRHLLEDIQLRVRKIELRKREGQ